MREHTPILIRDCAPRDGLQSESPVAPDARAELALRLRAAGVRHVEVAAFVSARAVPSMAQPEQVIRRLADAFGDGVAWALVPNCRGAQMAVDAGLSHLTMTLSASPGYGLKNVGMGPDDALHELARVRAAAPEAIVDAVISCSFGSPFDDVAGPGAPAAMARRCREQGADAVTLADTTGVATPRRVDDLLALAGTDVGLHLHDTRGTALANALHALGRGVRRFDTATGGLGGSPFAPGAGGNLATEDLVLVLSDMGEETGVDLDRLLDAARYLESLVDHALPGRVAAAGGLPAYSAG